MKSNQQLTQERERAAAEIQQLTQQLQRTNAENQRLVATLRGQVGGEAILQTTGEGLCKSICTELAPGSKFTV